MTLRDQLEALMPTSGPFERLEIVDPADLTSEEVAVIPPGWITAAQIEGPAAVQAALELWEAALPSRLPGTVADIRSRGLDVLIGRAYPGGEFPARLVLVYALTVSSPVRKIDACFGYLPAPADALPPFWSKLSHGIDRFHTGVHDGLRTQLGGLLPSTGLRPVSADPVRAEAPQPEFLDQNFNALPAERIPRLEDLVVLVRTFSDGVAVDLSAPDLAAWDVTDLFQPSKLETWSAIDAALMDCLSTPVERYSEFGYE